MNPRLLRTLLIAASAVLTTAQADHMSPWGAGWANMPNDIHNTRIDTRLLDDNDAFRDFVRYGAGADTTNRWLTVEAAAVEAEQASGHRVAQLAARLEPLPGFLGGGWARYTLLDDEALVSRVLNVNLRLRLIRPDGSAANETLGLTADNADETSVSAHFGDDTGADYALCSLVFDGLILNEDGVAEYAGYSLSLKEDHTGATAGTGACAALDGTQVLPSVEVADVVDVGVWTPATTEEVVPVLMGSF
jgi:hypothetical protein